MASRWTSHHSESAVRGCGHQCRSPSRSRAHCPGPGAEVGSLRRASWHLPQVRWWVMCSNVTAASSQVSRLRWLTYGECRRWRADVPLRTPRRTSGENVHRLWSRHERPQGRPNGSRDGMIMTVTFRLRLARPGAVRGTGNPSYSGVTSCPAAVRVASGGCSAEIGRVRAIVSSFRSLRTRRESLGQLPRPCGSWLRGGDEGLSLAAAAPGHARSSPALSRPRRCRAGHHAR